VKVSEVMTLHTPVCPAQGRWSLAANALWESDAGIVVLLDAEQRPVGVVTERDICRTVATREILPAELAAADLMSVPAPYCLLDDDVRTALRKLALHRVRGLPVVGADGRIIGMVTIQRILLKVRKEGEVSPQEVVDVLREVWAQHELPEDAVICGWEHR
jgi:CBS domain-containing protein